MGGNGYTGVNLSTTPKCNTFQDIIDLVHDYINFNVLKIILKIHKKIIKKDPGLTLTQGNLLMT